MDDFLYATPAVSTAPGGGGGNPAPLPLAVWVGLAMGAAVGRRVGSRG
jgi:hypothetical protein